MGENRLVVNQHVVEDLAGALASGSNGLNVVPDLIKRCLREGSWREFVTQRGEHVTHDRFAEFVVRPPLAGIGGSRDLLESICKDDPEALQMLRDAYKEQGRRPSFGDNVTEVGCVTGNSRAYTLDRLARDAPALHAEVIAGRLTPNAAMIKAGLRKRTLSVPVTDPARAAAALRRNMTPEALDELRKHLDQPEPS